MGWKVNNLLYAAGPDLVNTHRTEVTLREPVDPGLMEKAISMATARFPYFCVRLVRKNEEYRLEENPRPFVLSPGGKTVTLGTEESNEHLFAFAWDGPRFYADASHFITDGNGLFPFLKTILFYYLSRKYPEAAFEMKQITLAGDSVPEEEAEDDPYPEEPLPADQLGSLSRPDGVFMPEDRMQGYENMDQWTAYRFIIPQKELMAFVSSIDSSPATLIGSLIYRMITTLYPENRLPVVCGMQHQFRKALGKPFSHLSHVRIVPMVYPDIMRNRDLSWLNTVSRGMLAIRAHDENDKLTVNEHIRNEKMIRGMTLPQKQDYMRKAVLEGIGRNTFEVSYTGRVPWSGLDRYIENVVPFIDMTLSGGISAEIFSIGEAFSVNIMLRTPDSRYPNLFADMLKENGIQYTAKEPEHFSLCGFRIPE